MTMLNESKRDDLLLPYVELLKSKGINCTLSSVKRELLQYFTETAGIRNLSLGSNFYLAGIARYYFNGDLTTNKDLALLNPNGGQDVWDEEICKRLNALVLILRNSIVDSIGQTFEQPEDFGTLTLPKLLKKYNKKINDALGIVAVGKDKNIETIDNNVNVGNGYTFDILYSYHEAQKYYKYTNPGAWCITYGEQHFNSYVRRLGIHYVIFRKDGYENVPRQKGPEWTKQKPQDEYGCSLIALLQSNSTGEPIYITSRWNHGHYSEDSFCEADHAFTKEEFFAKTGVTDADLQRIFKIWNINRTKRTVDTSKRDELKNCIRDLKYRQMRINGGENPDSVLIKIPNNLDDTTPGGIERFKNGHKIVLVGNGKPLKSIVDYETIIEGVKYHVLVDRGQILFETLIPSSEYRRPSQYMASYVYTERKNAQGLRIRNDYWWLKDMMVIRWRNNTYKLYNVRLHQFLSVDGVSKFKYIENTRDYNIKDGEDVDFYELKMSKNQIALVNCKTNIPLKLPNGRCWFEEIYYDTGNYYSYGREVKPNLINKKAGRYFAITYDSASNEAYIYDNFLKTFVSGFSDIIQKGGGLHTSIGPTSVYGLNFTDIYQIPVGERWNAKLYFMKDNKMYSFAGFPYVKSLYGLGNGYVSITPYEEGVSTLDSRKNKILWSERHQTAAVDDDGVVLEYSDILNYSDVKLRGSVDDIVALNVGEEGRKYVFISLTNNCMFLNPYTKDKIFILESGYFSHKLSKRGIISMFKGDFSPVDVEIQSLYDKGLFYKNVFRQNNDFDASTENPEQELATSTIRENYDVNDIKKMVLEALNKILNKQ